MGWSGGEAEPAADLVELLHLGGHHVEVVARHEHLAEAVLGGQARRRLGGERGLDPRGEVALVAGLGPDGGRRDLEHLPVEGEALGAVGRPDGVDDVVEVGVRLLDRDAERGVLVRRHAAPDAEVEAATLEEDVEHRQLAGQADRVPPRAPRPPRCRGRPATCAPPSTPGTATGWAASSRRSRSARWPRSSRSRAARPARRGAASRPCGRGRGCRADARTRRPSAAAQSPWLYPVTMTPQCTSSPSISVVRPAVNLSRCASQRTCVSCGCVYNVC